MLFQTLLPVALLSVLAGGANSIAGGGTLLTFPALVGLGVPPIVANATSAVALVPGSFFSMLGYRSALRGARAWVVWFALPSVVGGTFGAWLLVHTPAERFDTIVPYLVLGATILFLAQRPLLALLRRPVGASVREARPTAGSVVTQTLVAIYGGYFGAAAGIVMLGTFGLMGLTDIHQMNGLKNWAAVCFNSVAATGFIVVGLVDWPVAAVMAVGSALGGWSASKLAQRVPREQVRMLIGLMGLAAAAWLFTR